MNTGDPRTQVTFADDFHDAQQFVHGLVDLTSQTFSRPGAIPKGGVGKVTHPSRLALRALCGT